MHVHTISALYKIIDLNVSRPTVFKDTLNKVVPLIILFIHT